MSKAFPHFLAGETACSALQEDENFGGRK
jgi:hypothetical protein